MMEGRIALRSRLARLGRTLGYGHMAKFLVIGILSFAIDLGTLTLLKEVFHVDLWIATPIAFIVSLLFNFWAQRVFTFKASNSTSASFLKYAALVVFNVFATDVIVNVINAAGLGYAFGKVCATVATMAWNFLLYKYWIFRSSRPVAEPVADER